MNRMSRFFVIAAVISVAPVVSALDQSEILELAAGLNPASYMGHAVSEDEKLRKLEAYDDQIQHLLNENPEDPRLWWLQGLHAWCVLYALDKPPIERNRALKDLATEAFRKALAYDDPENPKLTVDMLYSFTNFGSSDVHVAAAERILDEGPELLPREEIEIRGGMIQHLLVSPPPPSASTATPSRTACSPSTCTSCTCDRPTSRSKPRASATTTNSSRSGSKERG